jgi:hypothetical protein
MKKSLIACAALVCSSVFAAGPFDGIYARPGSTSYTSVHTNGSAVVMIGLQTLPTTNIRFSSLIGSITPTSIGNWDVATGVINGNVINAVGTAVLGACNVAYTVVMSGSSAEVTLTGVSNTLIGNQSGVNCQGIWNAGPTTYTAFKLF